MKKNNLNNQLYKTKLRVFFASLFFIILAVFLCLKIVPNGKMSFNFSWPISFFSARSHIFEFRPGARIDSDDDNFLKIVSDPVYFSLFSPRNFDQAKVKITYYDNLDKENPIVELGLLKGGVNGSYELKPVQNKLIDSLKLSWHDLIDKDGLLVLQKEGLYTNQEDFWQDFNQGNLKNCSGEINSCSLFYNYLQELNYKLAVNESVVPLKITQALRGSHRFIVYIPKGDWNLKLYFRDLFLKDKQQDVKVEIYSQDELLKSKTLEYIREDVSNFSFDNSEKQGEEIGFLNFSGYEDSANLYTVVVKADNDIVIESIESSSNHLVFLNNIWPVYSDGPSKLYTDSSFLSFKTFETESLGKVTFNNKEYSLNKTYSHLPVNAEIDTELKEIILEKSGILIELNGVISLSKNTFFNPLPYKLDRFFSEDLGKSYLLANYNSPKKEGNLKIASLSFDLAGAIREKGKYNFVISIPGLVNNPSYNGDYNNSGYLGIKKIEIELVAKNLWQKLKKN